MSANQLKRFRRSDDVCAIVGCGFTTIGHSPFCREHYDQELIQQAEEIEVTG